MSLADARADLAETLADTGFKVHAYETPKVISGAIVIDEAEPLLEYGDVASQPNIMKVNFNVWLFQDNRNPANATKAMDEMVANTVLNLGEWTLTNLRSHIRTKLQDNGPVWLCSIVSVTKFTTIGDV